MAEIINYIEKDEIFKNVKIDGVEYENYLISNYGRVYSLIRRKFIKGYKDYKGYIKYSLYKNGKRKLVSEHRLVGFAFVDNPNGYKIINHRDQTRDNSYYKNLEWCTNSYNVTYGDAQQRRIAKIIKPVVQLDNNHKIIAEYPSLTEASRKTNSAISTIFNACRYGVQRKGFYWAYVNSEVINIEWKKRTAN